MEKNWNIAIYMRLSKEDAENKDESSSISSQRKLLRQCVIKKFTKYRLTEYADDGYSGMNFNRPALKKLLDMVRKEEINCIIVKDFSRFSRDYITLGDYLEQIFPFMGVRFISINDGYDSMYTENADGLSVSFKGLLYDLYSKDLSVKIKASLQNKKDRGEYACANVPFGYKKDSMNPHKLCIEEKEAAVVRQIFHMACQGAGAYEIARSFNHSGVTTPAAFKKKNGLADKESEDGRSLWSAQTVYKILNNPVYTGALVYNKYENGKLKPQNEWKIRKGQHEPVISEEIYNKAGQKRINSKANGQGAGYPLTGKLICGECKKSLSLKKGKHSYYTCSTRWIADLPGCIRHLSLLSIQETVYAVLKMLVFTYADMGNLCKYETEQKQKEEKRLEADRKHAYICLQNLKMKKAEIYAWYAAKKIDLSTYRKLNCDIMKRKHAEEVVLSASIKENTQSKRTEIICDYMEMNPCFIDFMIQKIIIYDENHVVIRLRFAESSYLT